MAAALDSLDIRRRRIRIRAWRRGMREMDIILGRFVDAEIARLSEAELDALEALLEAPDDEAFRWLARAEPAPPAHDTPLLRKIVAFHMPDAP